MPSSTDFFESVVVLSRLTIDGQEIVIYQVVINFDKKFENLGSWYFSVTPQGSVYGVYNGSLNPDFSATQTAIVPMDATPTATQTPSWSGLVLTSIENIIFDQEPTYSHSWTEANNNCISQGKRLPTANELIVGNSNGLFPSGGWTSPSLPREWTVDEATNNRGEIGHLVVDWKQQAVVQIFVDSPQLQNIDYRCVGYPE